MASCPAILHQGHFRYTLTVMAPNFLPLALDINDNDLTMHMCSISSIKDFRDTMLAQCRRSRIAQKLI